MENYLPVFVPIYGAFVILACCSGCFYSRLLNRVASLENRYRALEDNTYRRNQQTQVLVHPAAPPPAAPTLVAIRPAAQPAPSYYYPTPGIYPTRGAYQPPVPSAPPSHDRGDPVSYQAAPKRI